MGDLLQTDAWLVSPCVWAAVTGALALWCLAPRGGRARWRRAGGGVLGAISVGLLAAQLPLVQPLGEAALFWLLAAVTVVSAGAMISMRSPVYCAIWFAMTLLGVASLFLLEGAQFLAVATLAVYAGAIVVMFLFLIMLAQPEGHEYYDRISWTPPAALFSAIAGAAIVLTLTAALAGYGRRQTQLREEVAAVLAHVVDEDDQPVWTSDDIQTVRLHRSSAGAPALEVLLKRPAGEQQIDQRQIGQLRQQLKQLPQLQGAAPTDAQVGVAQVGGGGVGSQQHVATLGGVLFSRYLVAVEIAGTLLLAALVGAVAIVGFGREQQRRAAAGQSASPSTGGPA